MKRIAAALLMILPVAGQAEGIWTTMTGAEIRQALEGTTLLYSSAGQTFYASGKTLYNQGGRESWGAWRVENDQYCSTWPPSDLWACYHMDRRPGEVRFIGKEGDVTVGQIKK